MAKPSSRIFDLSHLSSLVSFFVLIAILALGVSTTTAWIAVLFLAVAVMTSVHHAEVIAKRVGPSMGALILAVAVTVIEVGLILSLMTNDSPETAFIARDTVYSAVIIVTNGIVGVCFLLGGIRYREQGFNIEGASSLLAVLAALVGLTLILPNYTSSSAGPTYTTPQLIFVSIASLLLYFGLVVSQTMTHKDYFDPLSTSAELADEVAEYVPTLRQSMASFAGLAVSLAVVIGLAKALSPTIEAGVTAVGAPRAMVGIVIALLVLLPETWAAVAAARANQLQTSLNLALGSGAASIALTIPVVSVFCIMTDRNLSLGLDEKGTAFVVLTFIVCGLTLGTGKTSALKGVVHLVLLCAYLVLAFLP